MKFKTSLLLLLLSFAFIAVSCDDDDDPTYEWRTLWLTEVLDADGNVVRTDTISDTVQKKSEEDATLIIKGAPSSFLILGGIIDDKIIDESDFKKRTILYQSVTQQRMIFSYTKIK